MSLRSVMDIQVDDSKFQAFVEQYKKFQVQLRKMPGAWERAAKEQRDMIEQTENMTAALMAQQALLHETANVEDRATRARRASVLQWRDIARSSGSMLANVVSAGKTILKWSGIAGLVGAGGLFGIDRMAQNVSATRRTAQGMGITSAQMKGWDVALGQAFDSRQLLGNFNRVRTSDLGALYRMGFGPEDATASPSELLRKGLPMAKQFADQYKGSPQLLAQAMQAMGWDQVFSPEDMIALQGMSPKELQDIFAQQSRVQGETSRSGDIELKWRALDQTLDEAKQKIGNVFVTGMVGLTGPLEKLSGAVSDVVKAFMESGFSKEVIGDIGDWLTKLAEHLRSGQFKEALQGFEDQATRIWHSVVIIGGALEKLAWLIEKLMPSDKTVEKRAADVAANPFEINKGGGLRDWLFGGDKPDQPAKAPEKATPEEMAAWRKGLLRASNENTPGTRWMQAGKPVPVKDNTGGSINILDLIGQIESGNKNPAARWVNDRNGNVTGRYQITDTTARAYGYDPSQLNDVSYARTAAGSIVDDLIGRYGADLKAILAGYNTTRERADAYVRGGYDDSKLLPETRAYIQNALSELARRGVAVDIRVDNRTGGDVTTQVRQASPS